MYTPICLTAGSRFTNIGKRPTNCAGNGERSGVKLKQIAKQAINSKVPSSSGDDLLRFVIDQTITTTTTSPKANIALSKLKSKYFALLNFAYGKGVKTGDLVDFIRQHGGLNFNTRVTSKKTARL
jgi:hypothetical protein